MRKASIPGLLAAIVILSSCAGGKKLRSYRENMTRKTEVETETVQKLETISRMAEEKMLNRELDETSGKKIIQYADSMENEIRKHRLVDSVMLSARIRHRDLSTLTQKSIDLLSAARVNLENVNIINQVLGTNTFVQFQTATLFPSGQYHLADNLYNRQTFQSLVDEITVFAGKFPGKKLTASIIVLGYADSEPISAQNALGVLLTRGLTKTDWTSAELNQELSRRRALSVAKLVRRMVSDGTTGKPAFSQFSTEILPQGRGEEYPDPRITDYKLVDERRRVVKLYWNVLPF